MFASRSYLLISILAVASGAPKIRIKSSIPTWYLPCGEILEIDESNEEASTDVDVKLYVQRLKIQHNLTLSNYLLQDYDYLYEKVRIGVNEHQYIPNWVPGKKDANAMKRRIKSALSPQTVSAVRLSYVHWSCEIVPFRFSFEPLILLNDGWLIIYIKNNFFIYKSVLRKVKVKQIFFLEKQKIKSNHFNDSVINRRKKQKIDRSTFLENVKNSKNYKPIKQLKIIEKFEKFSRNWRRLERKHISYLSCESSPSSKHAINN